MVAYGRKLETATRAITGENLVHAHAIPNRKFESEEQGKRLRVWEFRHYEPLADGAGRSLRTVIVGTLQQFPSEAAIRKSPAVQAIVLRINSPHPLEPGALISRYEQEEMSGRYSTRASYQSFIDGYIRPRWAETPIANLKPMAVEDWLKHLKLAPKTRSHPRFDVHDLQMCAVLGIIRKQSDGVGTSEGCQQAA
jgi:hypothetical protein